MPRVKVNAHVTSRVRSVQGQEHCQHRMQGKECVEVGLVKRVHTLFVRSAEQVVYKLQVREKVEGVRQEVREVKRRHIMSACE